MFPALGAVLGLLHTVAVGVLRRGIKFQTCTNTLNKFFLAILGIFGPPPRIFWVPTRIFLGPPKHFKVFKQQTEN